jgi:NAD(P)-dependent dehydrogenase (short-subunit alcohol dehydrogenase family)
MSTWFITGVSRGIGRELTEQVLARGDRVAATLRRPEQLDDLKERFGGRLWTRRLDVTDTGEIDRVVREAFADHDRIDVVVSNAGYGVFGVAEDLSDEQVDGMLATNLTGSIQLAAAWSRICASRAVASSCSSPAWAGTSPSPVLPSTTRRSGASRATSKRSPRRSPRSASTRSSSSRGWSAPPSTTPPSASRSATRTAAGPPTCPTCRLRRCPGSQSGVAHAIVEAALSHDPPRRLLLNSDTYGAVTAALRERLAALEAQRESAYAADAEYTPGAFSAG